MAAMKVEPDMADEIFYGCEWGDEGIVLSTGEILLYKDMGPDIIPEWCPPDFISERAKQEGLAVFSIRNPINRARQIAKFRKHEAELLAKQEALTDKQNNNT